MLKLSVAVFMLIAGFGCLTSAYAQGQGAKTIFNNSKVAITVSLTPSGASPLKQRILPYSSYTFNFDASGITTLVVSETTPVDSVSATFRAAESSSTLPNIDHTFNDNSTLVITFDPSSFSFGLTADQ